MVACTANAHRRSVSSFDDHAVAGDCEARRRDLDARGVHVLVNAPERAETATTVRVCDGETVLSDGPFTKLQDFPAGIDNVVSCADANTRSNSRAHIRSPATTRSRCASAIRPRQRPSTDWATSSSHCRSLSVMLAGRCASGAHSGWSLTASG